MADNEALGLGCAILVLIGIWITTLIVLAQAEISPVWAVLWGIAPLVGALIYLAYRELAKTRYKKKTKRLVSSGNYRYLQSYVKRYEGGGFDTERLGKLKDLLAQKGILLSDQELRSLISEEIEMQDYKDFKGTMLSLKPKKLEDYLVGLLRAYGDRWRGQVGHLKKLLDEKGVRPHEAQVSDVQAAILWEMPEPSLIERIEAVKRKMELSQFERQLEADGEQAVSVEDLDFVTGYEFEGFLETLFEKAGYVVEPTKLSGDQGADLIISRLGKKIVVQAKRQSSKVTNKAIQEVVAAIKHYGADKGMVVTTNQFTWSAIELAGSNGIELIDRAELEKLIRKYS